MAFWGNMHFSYLVLIFVTLTVQSVLSASMGSIVADCQKNLEYDGDIGKLNYNDPNIPEKAKCVMACSLEKKGVIKEDGSIDISKGKELTEEMFKDESTKKKFQAAIGECIEASAKDNKCETAYQLLKCIHNKADVSRK